MGQRSLTVLVLLLLIGLLLGCAEAPDGGGQTRNFIHVKDDDPEMDAAIQTARATLGFFEKNWQTMPNDGCSLKFVLPTRDGRVEHIWFAPTAIQGDQFTGQCANRPVNVEGLQLGDIRTVSRSDLSDWMIVSGNKCYGGYTIRVLAKRDPNAAPPLEYVDPPAN